MVEDATNQQANQANNTVNKQANTPETQANTPENTVNQLIADLDQKLEVYRIHEISEEISKGVEAAQDTINRFNSEDPESIENHRTLSENCNHILSQISENLTLIRQAERIKIQELFSLLNPAIAENDPKLAEVDAASQSLRITDQGQKFLGDINKYISFEEAIYEEAKELYHNGTLLPSHLDPNTGELTPQGRDIVVQQLSTPDDKTIPDILADNKIDDTAETQAAIHNFIGHSMSLHDNLAELHAELCDQVNALVTLEASNRVMTREKIKLTKELGVRVADGNEFTIEENGVKRQYIIQSVQFENFLNFDKLSNLQLTCKQVSPLTNDDPEVFSTSYLKDLASENKILPACESATALQERLGFPSMGQNFDVGTEFHYRLENNDAQRFEIAKIDPYNREIYLSKPIPVGIEGHQLAEQLKNEGSTDMECREQDQDGNFIYRYSMQAFLAFTYKYQVEEYIGASRGKDNALTGDKLDQYLTKHHSTMLEAQLAISKLPIEIKEGNILGNSNGDIYKILGVEEDSNLETFKITLQNESLPDISDEIKNAAHLTFTLPEFIKFVKDQNLGMSEKAKAPKKTKLNTEGVPFQLPDMPKLKYVGLGIGLMSMKDVFDISKAFGEKVSSRTQRKRDLRRAKYQKTLGQSEQGSETLDKNFKELVENKKGQYQRQGNSITWVNELKGLSVTTKSADNRDDRFAEFKALIELLAEGGNLPILEEWFILKLNKLGPKDQQIKADTSTNAAGDTIEFWADADGTKNKEAVAEALNYIFDSDGQPSTFGSEMVRKNRAAFSESMNRGKSETDAEAKEFGIDADWDAKFGVYFKKLQNGKAVDAGEYTGCLQALIDGGYANLPTFFFYLYAGLNQTPSGNGPILDGSFVESLDYGAHPFLHAFTVHRQELLKKKEEIFGAMVSWDKKKIPHMNEEAASQFIWTYLLPLSNRTTKKHADTVEKVAYAKEYPGYVFSKLTESHIFKLFKVGDPLQAPSFGGTNDNKHKDAFGQFMEAYQLTEGMAATGAQGKEHHGMSTQAIADYVGNLLRSSTALYGLTHGRIHTNDSQDKNANRRAFEDETITDINKESNGSPVTGMRDILSHLGGALGVGDTSTFLDDSEDKYIGEGTESKAKQSHEQGMKLIEAIKRANPKKLLEAFSSAVAAYKSSNSSKSQAA